MASSKTSAGDNVAPNRADERRQWLWLWLPSAARIALNCLVFVAQLAMNAGRDCVPTEDIAVIATARWLSGR